MKKNTYIVYAKDAEGFDDAFEIKAWSEDDARSEFRILHGNKYSIESIFLFNI